MESALGSREKIYKERINGLEEQVGGGFLIYLLAYF
jgi:hypothetical protein